MTEIEVSPSDFKAEVRCYRKVQGGVELINPDEPGAKSDTSAKFPGLCRGYRKKKRGFAHDRTPSPSGIVARLYSSFAHKGQSRTLAQPDHMQPATKQLLSLLLQNDSSLNHHERDVFKHLVENTPLSAGVLPGDKRLISASEACERLDCGKTHFYAVRHAYPELTPITQFGNVSYRLDWILSLIDRLSHEVLTKGAEPCHLN